MRHSASLLAPLVLATLFIALPGCSEDPPPPPPPPPTQLTVAAVDSSNGNAIPKARILVRGGVWLEAGDDGRLTLELEPGETSVRVQAAGYFAVPAPLRIEPATTVVAEQTVELEVALQPSGGGAGVVSGTVVDDAGAPVQGALVVASATSDFTAHSDAEGGFVIAGLDSNFYNVQAYFAGYSSNLVTSVDLTGAAAKDGVALTLTAGAGATVGGAISGEPGSVAIRLVHPRTRYGIPGLDTTAASGGRWSVAGVPPGTFAVQAALELDGVVLDPEPIRSLGLPSVTVTGTSSVTANIGLKPSIRGIAPVGTSSVTPTFSWPAVASADYYVLDVRDAANQTVWGGFDSRGIWRDRVLAPATSIAYGGPRPLTRGARYSWRVYAARQDPLIPSNFQLIAGSEVFEGEIVVPR